MRAIAHTSVDTGLVRGTAQRLLDLTALHQPHRTAVSPASAGRASFDGRESGTRMGREWDEGFVMCLSPAPPSQSLFRSRTHGVDPWLAFSPLLFQDVQASYQFTPSPKLSHVYDKFFFAVVCNRETLDPSQTSHN